MPAIKNKPKNKFFTIFLAAVFIFLAPASAGVAAGGVSWQVENFGVFQTPAKWQTVKLEEVLERLDKMFQKLPGAPILADVPPTAGQGNIAADFVSMKNLLNKILQEQNLNIYQIVLDDKNAYYTAGLLLFKEDKLMPENEAVYFDKKTSKKNRQDFAAILMGVQSEAVNSARMWSEEKPFSDTDFKVFPAGQVEQLTVKNAAAYGIGSRFIVNAFGLTGPYYVKTYVFNLDGHMAYAVLWSIDSERAFWDKTFRSVISSLQ